jgi:hypothetical protein
MTDFFRARRQPAHTYADKYIYLYWIVSSCRTPDRPEDAGAMLYAGETGAIPVFMSDLNLV